MTEKDRTAITFFEEKLHRLVYEYKRLQEANRELSSALEEKENTLKELQLRCSALENSYNDLKQAKVVSLTAEGVDETKERISRLVREIDRCIESLKK
jgi:phage shock protein A